MTTPAGEYQHPQAILDLIKPNPPDKGRTLEWAYEYEVELRLCQIAEHLQNTVGCWPSGLIVNTVGVLVCIEEAKHLCEHSMWPELNAKFQDIDARLEQMGSEG